MERNTYTLEKQYGITCAKLYQDSKSIQSMKNRDLVKHIISAARANANDTLAQNKDLPDTDWDRMFCGSIGVLLCTGEYDRHVIGFFTRRGITW